MTKDQRDELVQALADYQFHQRRYRHVYEALGDYKNSDDRLRRLLWLHAPGLIAPASVGCSCCGCTRRDATNASFVCGVRRVDFRRAR